MEGKIFFIITPFLAIGNIILFKWFFKKKYSENHAFILSVLILGVSGYLFLGSKPDGPSEFFRLFYSTLFICGVIGSFLLLFFGKNEIEEEIREEIVQEIREEIEVKEDLNNTTTEE